MNAGTPRPGRLTAGRRRVVDRVFAELTELPPADRSRRLVELRGSHPRIALWLERLLVALEHDDDSLHQPLGRLAEDLADQYPMSKTELSAGTRLGSWEVLEAVGAGGMGVVYRVARADGAFEMVAAAKLIRMRLDARLEARLALERRLLARLDHPNIARIVDGGTTGDGQPFLVMEWVPGEDLAQRARSLTPARRLEVFQEITAAVSHAHQRSVVHGDIKPANVRVGADGRIRLLDFGVARLVQDDGPDEERPAMALTPAFAAPEQLKGQPPSTQSDVWALGALLAWLLAGDAIRREQLVCADALNETLSKRLPRAGDLAAIIARACADAPDRRYASVSEMAEDLERHRRLQPVSARPASGRYVLGRFVLRNPLGVGLGLLSGILLLGGLVGVTWQAHVAGLERDRAERQRDRAELEAATTERVSEFVVGLFEQADPYLRAGAELTARDLLEQGRQRIATLDEAPDVQAQMHQVLARVHRSLAEHAIAHDLSTRALSILDGQDTVDPARLAAAWSLHASTLASLGRYRESEQAHRRALEMTDPDDVLELASRLNNLGLAVYSLGRLGEAESLLETALGLRVSAIPDSAETAASFNNLALVLAAQDRREEAEPLYRRALDVRRTVLGADHPTTTYSMTNLATLLSQLGRWQEAEAAYLEALAQRREIFGDAHPAVASVLYQIGWLQSRLGEYRQAREYLGEALLIRESALGADHPSTAVVLNALAGVARELGELEQAETWLRRVLDIYRESYGDSHHDIALVLANLGRTVAARGELAEAERLLGEALEMNRRELGTTHRHVADDLLGLAKVHFQRGQPDLAARRALDAREVLLALGAESGHPRLVEIDELLDLW
ncbi:MAG: hypothetical protein EA419_09060, partial [Wenzhouxiangella sp.]